MSEENLAARTESTAPTVTDTSDGAGLPSDNNIGHEISPSEIATKMTRRDLTPKQEAWTCVGLVESCLFTPGLPSRTGPGSGSRASSAAGSDCRTRRCIWPPRSRLGRGSARRPARSVRT